MDEILNLIESVSEIFLLTFSGRRRSLQSLNNSVFVSKFIKLLYQAMYKVDYPSGFQLFN